MKTLVLMLAAAVSSIAQPPTPPPPTALIPGEVIRVIEVKSGANGVYQSLKTIFPGISLVNENRVLVRGTVSVVDMIEEAIKKLDTPTAEATQNVELTLQILQGSAEGAGGPVPGDLDATIKQLRSLFGFKSFKLLDTQIIRTRSGRAGELGGALPGSTRTFFLYVTPTVNPPAAPNTAKTIHLAQLRFTFRTPKLTDATQFDQWTINTDLDAKEGQKTVVGKSNIPGTEDAIILVLTPKVE